MPATPPRRPRVSLRTKFLLPVLACLVLGLVAILAIVNRHIAAQAEDEARQTLGTAAVVFIKSLEIRTNYLVRQIRSAVQEPRFKAAATTDRVTFAEVQWDLLGELGAATEVMLYVPADGRPTVREQRRSKLDLDEFEKRAAPVTEAAFAGSSGIGCVTLSGNLYTVIAVPVTLGGSEAPSGVLTVGVRLDEGTLRELSKLTNTEIALQVAAADPVATVALPASDFVWPLQPPGAAGPAARAVQPVVLRSEHFLGLASVYRPSPATDGIPFLLLVSYEKRMESLAETRRLLGLIGALGIVLAAGSIWVVATRATQPLRELRDNAEAVGRGDFSRRLAVATNDETGDLAEAFNRMSGNLQTSRAQLEDSRVALEQSLATLKATQNQLVQSEKLSAVGQFVAGVAHELNNPLTAVIGFAGLVQKTNAKADEDTRTNLDFIVNAADRCHRIVRSLLGFARQHTPERKLADVNHLLDEVIEIMVYDLRTSNIKVVKDYQAPLPRIFGDAHQLQQVFINILANARQAVQGFRRDGQVTLRTRADGGTIRIELGDNGPGIKPEHLAKIFDPFFTTKPVGKGTGLGMSLSYGLIQEHGGKISIQSTYGHGATFVIELPVATPEALAQAPAEETKREVELPKNLRVLVVDDELPILRLVRELLASEGHRVETAESGERALALTGQHRFDVIVCDWKMPGLSGIQLHEYLQTAEPALARRLLFMTGDVVNEALERHLAEHARPCLRKPFTVEEFRAAVAQVLHGAGA